MPRLILVSLCLLIPASWARVTYTVTTDSDDFVHIVFQEASFAASDTVTEFDVSTSSSLPPNLFQFNGTLSGGCNVFGLTVPAPCVKYQIGGGREEGFPFIAFSGPGVYSHSGVTLNITNTPDTAPSPTPAPPSVWMAMTGLAGAGLFRWRQKRHEQRG